jgi:hypothetical protein
LGVTDVSGQSIGPIFKGQTVLEWLALEDGPIGCPETSVTKHQSTPCNTQQTIHDVYIASESCNHVQSCSSLPQWLFAKLLLFSELLCDSATQVFFRVYDSLLTGTPLTAPPVTAVHCYNNTIPLYRSLNVCIVRVVWYYSLSV